MVSQAHGFRSEKLNVHRILPSRNRGLLLVCLAISMFVALLAAVAIQDVTIDCAYSLEPNQTNDWADLIKQRDKEWYTQFEKAIKRKTLIPAPLVALTTPAPTAPI